jgi:hypothetical protein
MVMHRPFVLTASRKSDEPAAMHGKQHRVSAKSEVNAASGKEI